LAKRRHRERHRTLAQTLAAQNRSPHPPAPKPLCRRRRLQQYPRENASTSKPQPRHSLLNCCTSSVNPPPRVRRNDEGDWLRVFRPGMPSSARLLRGGHMKIKALKTFVVGNPPPGFGGRYFIFLKLITDDGIEGVGEVYTATFGPHVVARMIA